MPPVSARTVGGKLFSAGGRPTVPIPPPWLRACHRPPPSRDSQRGTVLSLVCVYNFVSNITAERGLSV